MNDFFEFLGVKEPVLFAGLFGGVLRALSRKQYKLREMIASPVCGALASAYLTVPALHYLRTAGWPMPPPDSEEPIVLATAFLIGTSAMWISDFVFEMIVRRFKPAPTAHPE